MATTRQKKAIKKMVENGGIVSRAMIDAGYSPETAKVPQKLTESKGFKELMAKYGLTEELVTTALVDDINAKPKRRILELSLAAKILRMDKSDDDSKGGTVINNVIVFGKSDPLAKQLEEIDANRPAQLDS